MAAKKFSKHFTLEELYRSDTATSHNVSNVPGKTETKNLQNLTKLILDPIRDAVNQPIKVNSAFRNVKVNKLVGGVSTSAHCFGLAADIVCPRYGNAKAFAKFVADYLKKNNIAFDQVIYEFNSWVHVGLKHPDGRQRGQVITINKYGTHVGIV